MANNPFYVQPASPLQGFGALMGGVEAKAERERLESEKAAQQEMLSQGAEILQSGTPEQIASFAMKNPGLAGAMDKAIGFRNEATKQNAIQAARDILLGNIPPAQALINRAEMVIAEGGDASGTMQLAEQAQQDPQVAKAEAEKVLALYDPEALKQYIELTRPPEEGAGMEVAGIKEFEYLTEGLSEEEKAKARRVKLGLSPRASESAVAKAEKEFAKEVAKLEARLGLEPQVAGAVAAAKNQAAAEAKEVGEAKSNEKAWAVYDGAMSNLAKAMAGTETGPFVGFIPAVTSNAQIAEGAVAVMAPVLKQMFRASGEGVFTDKDQQMLMGMVPTRKDLPAARVAKVQAIDSIVRAKLGMEGVEDRALPEGVTEEDIAETMRANNMTREQVMSRLRGQ